MSWTILSRLLTLMSPRYMIILDCLSNSHCQHVFKAAMDSFLKDKILVMVTNQLQYLTHADTIVLLKAGKTVAQGSFVHLIGHSPVFRKTMLKYGMFEEEKSVQDLKVAVPTDPQKPAKDSSGDAGGDAIETTAESYKRNMGGLTMIEAKEVRSHL